MYNFSSAYVIKDKFKGEICSIYIWDVGMSTMKPVSEIVYQYLPASSVDGCQLLYKTNDSKIELVKEYPSGTKPKEIEDDIKLAFSKIGYSYTHHKIR